MNTIDFSKTGNFSGTQLTKVKAKTALNEKQKMNYNGKGVETRYFSWMGHISFWSTLMIN